MPDRSFAFRELKQRMQEYHVDADPLVVASMLLSLAIAKKPSEIHDWFHDLALGLQRARAAGLNLPEIPPD